MPLESHAVCGFPERVPGFQDEGHVLAVEDVGPGQERDDRVVLVWFLDGVDERRVHAGLTQVRIEVGREEQQDEGRVVDGVLYASESGAARLGKVLGERGAGGRRDELQTLLQSDGFLGVLGGVQYDEGIERLIFTLINNRSSFLLHTAARVRCEGLIGTRFGSWTTARFDVTVAELFLTLI